MKWIVLLLFGALGLGALVGGAWWAANRYQIVHNGVLTEGRVIEQFTQDTTKTEGRRTSYTRTSTGYYPVVEFQTEDGEAWRFRGSTGGTGKPILATGTEVGVVYHRSDPGAAVIVDFQQAWLGPLVLSVVGAISFIFGLGGFALIGGSDRRFVELQETTRRDRVAMRDDGVRIRAIVDHVRHLGDDAVGEYVLVCKGLRPGESLPSEFHSEHIDLEPDRSTVGRKIEIYLDPADRESYRVELGPLLKEILDERR